MSDEHGGKSALAEFSDQLANAVAKAGKSVVRVEARRRFGASGVAWGDGGLIVTADHVLRRDDDIRVTSADSELAATVVGRDPGTDVALLKVNGPVGQAVERGPEPRVGHLALLVGRPGEGLSTSIGVVSAVEGSVRARRGGQIESLIRTDATFFPGFSGGPMIDTEGRMVGLASSFFGRGSGAGLAIGLATLDRVVGALQSHGRIQRAYLGLTSQPVALPEPLRTRHGISQESGLVILGVESEGPADRAGILLGDVLLSLAGEPVRHTDDLRHVLSGERVGQPTAARVMRGGELRDLTIVPAERP